jgi:hypothetical protein
MEFPGQGGFEKQILVFLFFLAHGFAGCFSGRWLVYCCAAGNMLASTLARIIR